MAKNWKEVETSIKQLYLIEGKPLEEVRALMKEKYNFDRCTRAYKTHLERWECHKYRNNRRLGARVASQRILNGIEGAVPDLVALAPYNDAPASKVALLAMNQELQLQKALAREQGASLVLARQSLTKLQQATKSEDIDRSIANITKIEENIASMRKSIEALLTANVAQSSPPTGFASCWKQEPMTLEDAHGKLIPIPIELVISWKMFEDILMSHFRKLPGSRKVLKREYAIEDSLTQCTFSRTRPWSFFLRPGRKIDMSMIFRNAGESTVICPKCDTLSMEKKGVLINCKTPGCGMLFRTEDEGFQVSKRIPSGTAFGNAICKDPGDNDIEDKPASFKRVIIQIMKQAPLMPRHQPLLQVPEISEESNASPLYSRRDSMRNFGDALDTSRGMTAMSQNTTPRNIYGSEDRAQRVECDSYGSGASELAEALYDEEDGIFRYPICQYNLHKYDGEPKCSVCGTSFIEQHDDIENLYRFSSIDNDVALDQALQSPVQADIDASSNRNDQQLHESSSSNLLFADFIFNPDQTSLLELSDAGPMRLPREIGGSAFSDPEDVDWRAWDDLVRDFGVDSNDEHLDTMKWQWDLATQGMGEFPTLSGDIPSYSGPLVLRMLGSQASLEITVHYSSSYDPRIFSASSLTGTRPQSGT